MNRGIRRAAEWLNYQCFFLFFALLKQLPLFYSLTNWYSKHFPFPKRGLKYFLRFLELTGNKGKIFIKKLHNGLLFHVNPGEHIQKDIFWYGYYEKKHVLAWECLLEPHFTVVDVGANAGYYSIVASARLSKGKVMAFEPNPAAFQMLLENIRINRVKNIQPFLLALSNNEEEKNLFISHDSNSGMTGLSKPENFTGKITPVKTTTLDGWAALTGIEKIHFIKIDIEGAEMLALEGMKNLLQEHRPGIFIEVCDELLQRFGSTYYNMYSFFEGYQYNGFSIVSPNTIQKIHEPVEDELILFLPHEYVIPGRIKVKI